MGVLRVPASEGAEDGVGTAHYLQAAVPGGGWALRLADAAQPGSLARPFPPKPGFSSLPQAGVRAPSGPILVSGDVRVLRWGLGCG